MTININRAVNVDSNGKKYYHNVRTGFPLMGEANFDPTKKWSIEAPYQGSVSVDIDGHNISLTTLSKGSMLVKLDNSDKDSRYITW